MAILDIVQWPDARLSTVCSAVDPKEDLTRLIADMFETMYAAPGRGLAAPQVGILKRMFVMDVSWKDGAHSPTVCINPNIVEQSDTIVFGDEGCLSIPGVLASVARPEWVVLDWTDATGRRQNRRLEGFEARCAQHELDHLDGIVTFARLDDAARAVAEAGYAAL